VKPISGMPLSETHSSEMPRACCTIENDSSRSWTMRKETSDLAARLIAVRTSCQALPLNCSVGRSMTVSSATCTCRQPSASTWGMISSVAENTHGIIPCSSQ